MSEQDNLPLHQRLRAMQIVALALVMGVVVLLAIVLILVQTNGRGQVPPTSWPLISIIAVGFFVLYAAPLECRRP